MLSKNKIICNCENLKFEINHLKVEVFSLKNENKSLKSAYARNITSKFDFEKLFVGQKPNDKTGLGFKKEYGSKPVSSRPKDQISKRELNQPKNNQGHAFIYKDYSKDKSLKHQSFTKFTNNNKRFNYFKKFQKTHENNHLVKNEKLYKQDSNGYFYEISKTIVPRKIQSNES